jgi:hypothetical protein
MPQPVMPLSAAEFAGRQDQRGKARTYLLYAKSLVAVRWSGEAIAHLRATHPRLQHIDDLVASLNPLNRAAVPGMGAGNTSGLVVVEHYGKAFLGEVEPLTILGQLGYTPAPSQCAVPRDTSSGAIASWVLEGKAAPVFSGSFDTVTLSGDPKLSLFCVFTRELAESADPAAEVVFGTKLRHALARGTDNALLNPSLAASSETPASITHAAPSIVSSGGAADQVAADLAHLSSMLTAARIPFTGRAYVASGQGAEYIRALRYANGVQVYPDGDINGTPLLVSEECGDQVVLIHGPSLLVADGGIELEASRGGSLEMVDDPVGDSVTPTGATQVISMMQTNSVALMGLRFLNFTMGRPAAIARLSGFTYGVGTARGA